MSADVTGKELADRAINGNYEGIPYTRLDCQGFVEQVLKDCGVRKKNGDPYNWKGSNSMYRNHIKWRGTISECKQKFGCIPLGAFVFVVKNDGGEVERGYKDGLGNASHVGLYVGGTRCMDSQPHRGVGFCDLRTFGYVGLMNMVEYTTYSAPDTPNESALLDAVSKIRSDTSTNSEWLSAVKVIYKALKGV